MSSCERLKSGALKNTSQQHKAMRNLLTKVGWVCVRSIGLRFEGNFSQEFPVPHPANSRILSCFLHLEGTFWMVLTKSVRARGNIFFSALARPDRSGVHALRRRRVTPGATRHGA